MPAATPSLLPDAAAQLAVLGERIRVQRKALRVSATVAAEAAGMSRVTWHRIEKGEPSVTMGAYWNAATAVGLVIALVSAAEPPSGQTPAPSRKGWIPARIRLADYAQLRRLAWQVHGTDALTPAEALDVYERNARHLDSAALEPAERDLIEALRLAFKNEGRHV